MPTKKKVSVNGQKKIQVTKNYRLFNRGLDEIEDNRDLEPGRHKKLKESMKQYGFLWYFPVVCYRLKGKLYIKDGQHRLLLSEEMGLPVYYVVTETDFDVAIVSSAAKPWIMSDYIEKYIRKGDEHYREGKEFCEQFGISLGTGFALLMGLVGGSHAANTVRDGQFKIKEREWAQSVASLYVQLCALSVSLRKKQFLSACMALFRVDDFDPKRLIEGAENCREKLVAYATRDAYLAMLEDVYNYRRHNLVGLKAAALTAMKNRNPVTGVSPSTKKGK